MITYEQTEDGQDVIASTDDRNAELFDLAEIISEHEFMIEIPKDPGEDGKWHFTITREQVGEFAEMIYEIDGGELERLIAEWNTEPQRSAEAEAEHGV